MTAGDQLIHEKYALLEAAKTHSLLQHSGMDIQDLVVEVDGEPNELEGFLSVVKRVKVSYQLKGYPKRRRVSFIVKKVPSRGFQSRIVKSIRAFERERDFYQTFFPISWRVVTWFRHYGEKPDLRVPLPDFLYASKGDGVAGDVIILEDMCARGYRLPRCDSKVQGLDLDHCVLAMRALGRFHAVGDGVGGMLSYGPTSWVARLIYRTDRFLRLGGHLDKLARRCGEILPSIIRRLKRYRSLYRAACVAENLLLPAGPGESGGVLREIPELSKDAMWYESDRGQEPSIFLGVVEKRRGVIREVAKQLDGLPRKAEESGLLERELRKMWSVLSRSVRATRSGWNVLNHGDCWINNMLFKYETDSEGCEKPKDVTFIDLQFARFCHPAVDLLYFLYTSTHRSFRELHFDLLVSEYHSSLMETLKNTPHPPPVTLEDLKVDLRGEYKPFGVIIGTAFAPYLKLEAEVTGSSDDIVERDAHEEFLKDGNSSAALHHLHTNAKFRSFMEDNVRELTEVIFSDGSLGSVNPYWK